jgi:hypothetical protein
MRFFTTLMSWSNENKSCMRVDWILSRSKPKLSSPLIKIWIKVNQSWRERVHECRSKLAVKRGGELQLLFALTLFCKRRWEFMTVATLARVLPITKKYHKARESWWELRSESLHESFLNSYGHSLHLQFSLRFLVRVSSSDGCERADELWML